MTVTRSSSRRSLARFAVAAALLGAGLLIGSARPAMAGELKATSVAAPASPMSGAGRSDVTPTASPDTSIERPVVPTGMVGFGWG